MSFFISTADCQKYFQMIETAMKHHLETKLEDLKMVKFEKIENFDFFFCFTAFSWFTTYEFFISTADCYKYDRMIETAMKHYLETKLEYLKVVNCEKN